MRLMLLLMAAAFCCEAAGDAWAVNANPTPGSVWTYLGATFGADWMQPPQNTPANYGAKGDGYTVDTAAVQACLATAADGGPPCTMAPKARYNLAGGITLPRAATLDCGLQSMTDLTPPLLPLSSWGPGLLVDPAHPILFSDTSGKIQNCMISPIGMIFPQASAASWTGTAIDTNGAANPQIVNTTVVGFDTCINTSTNGGSQRPYLARLYLDCNGVTNGGSLITGNNGDIATVTDVKLQVLGTSAACPYRLRAGTGLKLVGVAWVDNLIAQDFQNTAIEINDTAQIFFGKVWIDYDAGGGCARGISLGMFVSDVDDLDLAHLDIQGVQNGIRIISQTNGLRSVHIGDLWLNNIGNDGVQLGGSGAGLQGGVVQIDTIRTNAASTVGGFLVNIQDSSNGTFLNIGGGHVYGVNGSNPPYINIGSNHTAGHFQISDRISTDLVNPYKFLGTPTVTSCTGIGTGGCSLLNSDGTTPWSGVIQVGPTGSPAASGEVQITWPFPFDNSSGCLANYRVGPTVVNWPMQLPIQVIDRSSTITGFQWFASTPLTAGTTYDIAFHCVPH